MNTQPDRYFEHRTIDGDRWDLLSYRYYGDQYKQSVLVTANRHLFKEPIDTPPMILKGGLTLRIPVLEEEETNEAGLPPWKRQNPDYGA